MAKYANLYEERENEKEMEREVRCHANSFPLNVQKTLLAKNQSSKLAQKVCETK